MENLRRPVSETIFLQFALWFFKRNSEISESVLYRKYRAFFGVTPNVYNILRYKSISFLPSSCAPRHLLYGLLFLKNYGTEHVHSQLFSAMKKLFDIGNGL